MIPTARSGFKHTADSYTVQHHPHTINNPAMHLQGSGVPRRAAALPGLMGTRGSIPTLTLELTALPIAPVVTGLLTPPAQVPVGAHTGSCDGVAQGSILTLAPVTAVRAPVIALTTCKDSPRIRGYIAQTNRGTILIDMRS